MTTLELAVARISITLPAPMSDVQRTLLLSGAYDDSQLEPVFEHADELAIDEYFSALWS